MSGLSLLELQLVQEFSLFEKQIGMNCTREQIGLLGNFHDWLRQPRVEIRESPICSAIDTAWSKLISFQPIKSEYLR